MSPMRNNYKEHITLANMVSKRGQMTLFIILALVIIAAIIAVLFYFKKPFLPPSSETSPQAFLKSCLEPQIKSSMTPILMNGGYSNPQGVLEYQGDKIKYLCYTAEFYKTCVVQEPFIKERVEQEVALVLQQKAQECKDQLVQEYQRKGYTVTSGRGIVQVLFSPHELNVVLSSPLTITKETTQTFKELSFTTRSELYDLFMLTQSIIAFEAAYGDSETTLYLQYYPDISIDKLKLSDGSKVYTVKNVVTDESFRFASRSLSWPAGYGLE